MVTDQSGKPITDKMATGLQIYYEGEDKTKQLCEKPSSLLIFEIDPSYAKQNEEDAEIYSWILPISADNTIWPISLDETITFSKQYGTSKLKNRTLTDRITKKFRVTGINKHISQDTHEYLLEIVVHLIPVDEVQ